jgi:VanZ family protein
MAELKDNRKLAGLFILLSIAWIGVLFAESSQQPAKIMGEVTGLDKLAHFAAYGLLAVLIYAAFYCLCDRVSPIVWFPLVIVLLIGGAEELYQTLIPDRSASLYDFLADMCGALLGIKLANRVALAKNNIQ